MDKRLQPVIFDRSVVRNSVWATDSFIISSLIRDDSQLEARRWEKVSNDW